MTERSPSAAGAILALTIIVGAVVGGLLHQGSAGFLAGTALGLLICAAVWLVDRRRTGR